MTPAWPPRDGTQNPVRHLHLPGLTLKLRDNFLGCVTVCHWVLEEPVFCCTQCHAGRLTGSLYWSRPSATERTEACTRLCLSWTYQTTPGARSRYAILLLQIQPLLAPGLLLVPATVQSRIFCAGSGHWTHEASPFMPPTIFRQTLPVGNVLGTAPPLGHHRRRFWWLQLHPAAWSPMLLMAGTQSPLLW
jgi:hypothetical protein